MRIKGRRGSSCSVQDSFVLSVRSVWNANNPQFYHIVTRKRCVLFYWCGCFFFNIYIHCTFRDSDITPSQQIDRYIDVCCVSVLLFVREQWIQSCCFTTHCFMFLPHLVTVPLQEPDSWHYCFFSVGFAFALWDESGRLLIAFTERFGLCSYIARNCIHSTLCIGENIIYCKMCDLLHTQLISSMHWLLK